MKNRLIIPVFLLLFLFLTACVSRETVYRDDIEINDIDAAVQSLIAHTDTMVTYDSDQVHFYLSIPIDYCNDCVVRAQTSSQSIDEYGIFHCNNEADAEALEELLNDYLFTSLQGKKEWLENCNTTELRKLEGGRVRRYGSYVCYTVLDPAVEDQFMKNVKTLLKIT